MPRYALYARKSDDDTRVTEKSIGEQVGTLTALAAERNLSVAACFEESRSARTPNDRPLYKEMIRRIESGDIDGVLCWHVNRLARNMEEGGKLAQLLIEGKIREIVTPHALYKSGDNILPLVLEAGTSAQFSVELSRNVKRGLQGHFEQGGVNYKVRPGYRNGRDPENPRKGVVLVDEPRFSLMRRGFELLESGAYTVAQVAASLTDDLDFRTRAGSKVSPATWYLLFRDPFYTGFVRYKGELRRGTHAPVVTEALFNRVQEVLDSRVRARQKRQVRTAKTEVVPAYSGLMRCGLCGQQITVERHRLRNGNPYVFYRCSDSWGRCTKKGLGESTLERTLVKELENVTLDRELCQIAVENIREELQARQGEVEALKTQSRAALDAVERQLWRLEEMWLSGLMEEEARFRERKKTLMGERERLIVAQSGTRSTTDEAHRTLNAVARFAVEARTSFGGETPARRREIAHAMAHSCRLFGSERRLEVEAQPVLTEFVRYARTLASQQSGHAQPMVQTRFVARDNRFEPSKTGFQSTKKAPTKAASLVGSRYENKFEVPESLVGLLLCAAFAGLAPL